MTNSSVAVFAGAMAILAFLSALFFIMRAEKIRNTGMKRRDAPMIIFLALALVSLFAFSVSFSEITDPDIAMPFSVGLVVSLGLAMICEVYLVLRSGSFAKGSMDIWMGFTLAGILLIIAGILVLIVYGIPNFPAEATAGIGLLITCYSFFSWLNVKTSKNV